MELPLFDGDVTPETKERAVWIDIDNAFSQPVTRTDDRADYAPTQIIAEKFISIGYDSIIYRSQFGEKGYNISLENMNDADPLNCAPYEITGIDIKFDQIGNHWSLRSD